MNKKYTVYFREEITYAVEVEVENDTENEAIEEQALQKIENDGRENYNVDSSGLTLSSVEENDRTIADNQFNHQCF
jgi:hypothetical protein